MNILTSSLTSALYSQDSLRKNDILQSSSIQRLASGTRLNSAADDAAGVSVALNMSIQMASNYQMIRSLNDGISLMQVADNSLSSISSILTRMREMALTASSDTTTDATRQKLQKEAEAYQGIIDDLVAKTDFNNQTIIDGSLKNRSMKIGTQQSDKIDFSLASAQLIDPAPVNTATNATGETVNLTISSPAVAALPKMTVASKYIEFSDNGLSGETIRLNTTSTLDSTLGKISIQNNNIYLGNGNSSALIGSVDSVYNGTTGKNLRINLVQQQFDNNTLDSLFTPNPWGWSTPGWSTIQSQVLLNGGSMIAGYNTPNQSINPIPGTQLAPILSASDIVGGNYPNFRTSSYAGHVELHVFLTSLTSGNSYLAYGPVVYSDSAINLNAGDNINFIFQNSYNYNDTTSRFIYLVDVNNGNYNILYNKFSTSLPLNISTSVQSSGTYKIIYVDGTYMRSAANLNANSYEYLDKITVNSQNYQSLTTDELNALTSQVAYQNVPSVSVGAKVNNIDVSATNAASVQDARNTVAAKIQALIDNDTLTNTTLTTNGDTLQLKSTQAGQNINIQLSDSNDALVVATTLNADPIPVRPFVDLTSSKQANFALTKIDAALDKVSNIRSAAGGYSNLFAAVADQKSNEAQSVTMSRSNISDTDFDKETAQLLKSKIVKMGAAAMLSQATSNLKLMMTILKMPASFDFHFKPI